MMSEHGPVGGVLVEMLKALQHRGRDSTGVAVYDSPLTGVVRINLVVKDVVGALSRVSAAIASCGGDIRSINLLSVKGFGYDEYIVRIPVNRVLEMVRRVNDTGLAKVVSVGRCLRITKSTDDVENFNEFFSVSEWMGTHGIGHVRYSTESVVDLFHAHPFQSFNYLDTAVVHNGQITNYPKMREFLERKGFVFTTSNDSELIVHYIVYLLEKGLSLEDALKCSVRELDGPFAYIIAMRDAVGLARDRLGLRPLVVGVGEKFLLAASEEAAVRTVGADAEVRYLKPGEVLVWRVKEGLSS